MKHLFNIVKDYLHLISELEDNEGEVTPELDKALTVNEEEFSKKLDSYAYIIDSCQGQIDIIDKEIKRLENVKTVKNRVINVLKKRIVQAVEIYGSNGNSGNRKYDTGFHKFYTVKTHSVLVNDEKWADYRDNLVQPLFNKEWVRSTDIVPEEYKWIKLDVIVKEEEALNHLKALAHGHVHYTIDAKPNKSAIKKAEEEEELPEAFEIQTYNTIRIN